MKIAPLITATLVLYITLPGDIVAKKKPKPKYCKGKDGNRYPNGQKYLDTEACILYTCKIKGKSATMIEEKLPKPCTDNPSSSSSPLVTPTPLATTESQDNLVLKMTELEKKVQSIIAALDTKCDATTCSSIQDSTTDIETCLGDVSSSDCPSSPSGKTGLAVALAGASTCDTSEIIDTCATLYEHGDYSGHSINLYANKPISSLAAIEWNDKISSIRIFGSNIVDAFEHSNFKGEKLEITHDTNPVSPNDWISSIRCYVPGTCGPCSSSADCSPKCPICSPVHQFCVPTDNPNEYSYQKLYQLFDNNTANIDCPFTNQPFLQPDVKNVNNYQISISVCSLSQWFLCAKKILAAIETCIHTIGQTNFIGCIMKIINERACFPCIREIVLNLEAIEAFGLHPKNLAMGPLNDQAAMTLDNSIKQLSCSSNSDSKIKVYQAFNDNCPWYKWPICAAQVIGAVESCEDGGLACIEKLKGALGSCWPCVQKACCQLGLSFCCNSDDILFTEKFTITYDLVMTGGDNDGGRLEISELITASGVCTPVPPKEIPNLPLTLTGGQSTWIENTLVFCGGSNKFVAFTNPIDEWGAQASCYSLKPGDVFWNTTALAGPNGNGQNDMTEQRAWFSLTQLNNAKDSQEMIAIGGINNGGEVSNTMEKYSFTSHTWKTLPQKLNNPRFGHCAVNYYRGSFYKGEESKSYVILIGGSPAAPVGDSWNPLNTVTQIDPETGAQEELPTLPEAVWGPACTIQGGFLYVSGGSSGPQREAQDKIYRYSFTGRRWITSPGKLNDARWGHVMGSTANSALIVAGGFNPEHNIFYKSVEQSLDDGITWTQRTPSLKTAREYAGLAEVPSNTFTC